LNVGTVGSLAVAVRGFRGINPAGRRGHCGQRHSFTYTNRDGVAEVVYIDGGTGSAIQKNSANIFTGTGRTVWLEPRESVIVIYSVPPTTSKDGKQHRRRGMKLCPDLGL
jgi:hypothetical protein